MGKSRGQKAPQRRVYKHPLERIGVWIASRALKTHATTIQSHPVPQGIGSAWLKCLADE